ncbi:hypothetical protein HY496_01160 [Candidatus Woesearchaeota archaeon]|nr:hypothetical protein [Candidatus Woesearchaeota archaeon]
MGVFDKLFGKKSSDLDFDKIAQQELGSTLPEQPTDLLNTPPPGFEEEKSVFEMPQMPSPMRSQSLSPTRPFTPPDQSVNLSRDIELMNSKLDTIKAMLASVEQRLANVERATGTPPPRQPQRLW